MDKMLNEGAPKSIFKIRELQDKLAVYKEAINREQQGKNRFRELIKNMEN